jgi:hypothetical protein
VHGRPPLSTQLLLHLQTTAGNQAVRRLLERRAAPDVATSDSSDLVVASETAPVPVPPTPARLSWWQRLRWLRQRRLPVPEGWPAPPAQAKRDANLSASSEIHRSLEG